MKEREKPCIQPKVGVVLIIRLVNHNRQKTYNVNKASPAGATVRSWD